MQCSAGGEISTVYSIGLPRHSGLLFSAECLSDGVEYKQMHTVHTILVSLPVDDAGKPIVDAAPAAVAESIPDVESLAAWYDYWGVGGRWDGYFSHQFPELGLENGNVLPIKGNEAQVLSFLDLAQLRLDNVFREYRDKITGVEVAESDVDGYVFGLPVASSQDMAARRTRENRDVSAGWQRILKMDSLADVHGSKGVSWDEWRPVYALQVLTETLNGKWNDESGYLDTIAHSAQPAILKDILHGTARSSMLENYPLERLALVAVDFHF